MNDKESFPDNERNRQLADFVHKYYRDLRIQIHESVTSLGNQLLKFTLIINGAAIISILTFVGNANKSSHSIAIFSVNNLIDSIYIFAFGVILGGLCTVFGYALNYTITKYYDSLKYNDNFPYCHFTKETEIQKKKISKIRSVMYSTWILFFMCFLFGLVIALSSSDNLISNLCLSLKNILHEISVK